MSWPSLYIIVTMLNYVRSQQRIIEGPTDTRVLIGGTALLRCRIEAQQGAVQWMKNGFGLGNDRDLSLFKRYSMEGRVSKGEYNLRIINVQMDDDDDYACQVEAAHENPTRISNSAKLTVLVEPENPKLLVHEPKLKAVAGQYVQQSCVSKHGKPPSKIAWAISEDLNAATVAVWLGDNKDKLSDGASGSAEFIVGSQETRNVRTIENANRNDDQTYNVISNISFAPRAEDDGKYLVCVVNHETYTTPRLHAVRLDLNYSPRVKLKLDNNSRLYEHGSAQLFCSVKAKPFENVEISWYRNGKEIAAAKTDTLSFPELKIEHHLSQYTCVAKNAIGDSSDSIVLNITYGAYITSGEQHQAVNPGETASFICEAVGNPTPNIYWNKVGDSQVLSRGKNLTIESVQSWQRGEYECTATVQGFPPARLVNYLHIKGPPSVSLSEEIIAANGDSVDIICEVRGRPQPQDVLWSLNGVTLEYGRLSGRLQIHQVPRQFGVESRLAIQSVRDSDFGTYNCTAYNELGRDFQTVELKPKSMVDAVIGIMPTHYFIPAAFLLLSVLITLICCGFWRCRRNTYKKATHFSDNHSDVNVKCEALDGGQFFPDMYNSISNESHELLCSKDYISIPQNNPDLDYLPPAPFSNGSLYTPYIHNSVDYGIDEHHPHIDHPHDSFASSGSAPLEMLAEVATPGAECASPLVNGIVRMQERPVSRTSTHV